MLKAVLAAALFASALVAATPTCTLVPGWSPQGEPRGYNVDNLFEYMDGNSEGYFLYGFQSMHGVTCVKDGVTLVIDISEFGDSDSAYGMFCSTRDLRQPLAKIGMGGQIVPRRLIFAKGSQYVEIAANPEGDHSAILNAWARALEKDVPGTSDPPAALAWFPTDKQQSLRLVPESVLGIRLLKRGYVAEYDYGKAFVVAEMSPETAAALLQKLRARFGDSKPAQIGDESFEARDQYLGLVCIFRSGRFIGGYAKVSEGADAVQLSRELAAKVK